MTTHQIVISVPSGRSESYGTEEVRLLLSPWPIEAPTNWVGRVNRFPFPATPSDRLNV